MLHRRSSISAVQHIRPPRETGKRLVAFDAAVDVRCGSIGDVVPIVRLRLPSLCHVRLAFNRCCCYRYSVSPAVRSGKRAHKPPYRFYRTFGQFFRLVYLILKTGNSCRPAKCAAPSSHHDDDQTGKSYRPAKYAAHACHIPRSDRQNVPPMPATSHAPTGKTCRRYLPYNSLRPAKCADRTALPQLCNRHVPPSMPHVSKIHTGVRIIRSPRLTFERPPPIHLWGGWSGNRVVTFESFPFPS